MSPGITLDTDAPPHDASRSEVARGTPSRRRRRKLATGSFLAAATGLCAQSSALADDGDWSATAYVARASSERTWQDIVFDPFSADFVDAYVVAAAASRQYKDCRDGALVFELEGQVAYNFGDQDHWEFNAVPFVVRWTRFPWSQRVATSAAFGLGLSYATEVPEVEVQLEGESHQLLAYWMLELTAGPPDSAWTGVLRLHHRSVAFGLFGDTGGINAVGLGVRRRFGLRAGNQ